MRNSKYAIEFLNRNTDITIYFCLSLEQLQKKKHLTKFIIEICKVFQ